MDVSRAVRVPRAVRWTVLLEPVLRKAEQGNPGLGQEGSLEASLAHRQTQGLEFSKQQV